jgi:hypothetical protein
MSFVSCSLACDAARSHLILFDSVGGEAKLLGEVGTASELLSVLEYLREKSFR